MAEAKEMYEETAKQKAWEDGCERPFSFDPNSSVNEGRFRLYPPRGLENYYRSDTETTGVYEIIGVKGGRHIVQALRFDKDLFNEEEARAWWEKHKGQYKFYEDKDDR